MKIVMVHNTYQQPGGEDVVFNQERQMLEQSGHRVVTFCRSNWEANEYKGAMRIVLAQQAIWNANCRKAFLNLLREEKPDVVHVHNTFVMISPSIYSACSEAGIPVVQTLHNYRLLCPAATFFREGKICEECLPGSLWPSVKHSCYHNSQAATAVVAGILRFHRTIGTWNRHVSRFVVLSEFARQKFIEGGMPADKLCVKPNFVHPDPGLYSGNREYAVFAGRLSPEKRVLTLLEAWKRCAQTFPLHVIGGGPDQQALEQEAADLNLHDIVFRGQLPRETTLAEIARARFLIFSSEWYETFGVTMVEAFACGTPVIASNIGAMKEIVKHGKTGLHFRPGDPDDLAQTVTWAWSHPDEMRVMGMAARREYEAKYTLEKNYPVLMRIYEAARQKIPQASNSAPGTRGASERVGA